MTHGPMRDTGAPDHAEGMRQALAEARLALEQVVDLRADGAVSVTLVGARPDRFRVAERLDEVALLRVRQEVESLDHLLCGALLCCGHLGDRVCVCARRDGRVEDRAIWCWWVVSTLGGEMVSTAVRVVRRWGAGGVENPQALFYRKEGERNGPALAMYEVR